MAGFARSRYGHLVHAAWASSGIFESAVYSWGKNQIMEKASSLLLYCSLSNPGPFDVFSFSFDIDDGGVCRELIEDAYEEIRSLVLDGRGEELGTRLNLCHSVVTDDPLETASLYETSVRAVMYYIHSFQ